MADEFASLPRPRDDAALLQHRLHECRRRFGPAPRRFDRRTERSLLVNPPWITRFFFRDALARLIRNDTQRRLFRLGEVVWGRVIQANAELFAPAPTTEGYAFDRPGEIVFSLDADGPGLAEELAVVARRLAGLRQAEGLDAELRPWADYLRAETTRVVGWPVPPRLSPSLRCFVSTTLFRRRHLPGGVLDRPLLPVVVAPDPPYFAMGLPAEFWPPELLDPWSFA